MTSIDRQAMQSFIEDALDAMWILDEDETILFANAAASALTGWRSDELLGQRFRILSPSQLPAPIHSRAVLRKSTEFSITTKDGRPIPVESQVFEIAPDHNRRRFGIVMRDIDDRRTAEIENRHLIDYLSEMTRVDDLTGLPNRRAFIDALKREIEVVRRHARPAVVAILDIDHFKRVNDSYGHPCGDEVLRKLARLFGLNLRSPDVIARIGGEEFGIVLLDVSVPEAIRKLDRLRQSVQDSPIHVPDAPDVSITVSIGAAACDRGRSPEDHLALADGALYRAKAGGRNRVVLA